MFRKVFAGLVGLTLLSLGVALADHDDHRDWHRRGESRHDRLHDDLADVHSRAHDRGFHSRREHAEFHRDLGGMHPDFHRDFRRDHDAFHQGRGRSDDDFTFGRRRDTPPGWSRGRKVGWGGFNVPPGQRKKGRF